MIERLGVVVPAHDEQLLLPRCLDALTVAASNVDVPVFVVVVLDGCTDRSDEVAAAYPWVTTLTVGALNVGIARRIGTAEVLRWCDGTPTSQVWLATTDADSVVPPGWLSGQLVQADAGWDVVVGTVAVHDWSEHPAHVPSLWARSYQPIPDHPHVHGANLGFRASSYLEAGGWPPLAVDEDDVGRGDGASSGVAHPGSGRRDQRPRAAARRRRLR